MNRVDLNTAFAFWYLECEQQQTSSSLVQYGRYRLVDDCASGPSVQRMFDSGNQLKGGVNRMAMEKMGIARGGHLYLQTNETRNCVVHYRRAPDGTLTEANRVFTGGAGSGEFKPISGQESAPNAFEDRKSVV